MLTVRTEAAQVLSTLIESVTIYPAGERGPEAEVVAKVSDLIAWATNDNAALGAALVVLQRWLRGQDLNQNIQLLSLTPDPFEARPHTLS